MTNRLAKIRRRVARHVWRGCPARMYAAIGAAVSLDAAGDLRRAGNARLARYALERARADRLRWQDAGGRLP